MPQPLSIARWIIMSLAALSAGGCADYGFDVTPAADHEPLHVNSDQDSILTLDPLLYQMRAVEGRLVVQIGNDSTESIQLLGKKSTVIDPDGLNHPLRERTIKPMSSIKEILPPFASEREDTAASPTPAAPGPFGPNDQPGYVPPPDFGGSSSSGEVDAMANPYYWTWDDEGEIRLKLVFSQAPRTFEQSFVIRRVKK